MKKIILFSFLLALFSCSAVKPTLNYSLACTNCSSERIEFWNQWLAVCAPGNTATSTKADWSHTTFRTIGVSYESFQKEDSLDYIAMKKLYPNDSLANKFLPDVIVTGSNYPDKVVINKGDYLTRIVKIGANISSYSVYYMTPKELERLKKKPSRIEQELGLPLTSNSDAYLVYRIHALDDNVVFQSQVAPTLQYSTPGKAVYWTRGGAIQTLIINNPDTTLWKKDSIPSDTLSFKTLPNINQIR